MDDRDKTSIERGKIRKRIIHQNSMDLTNKFLFIRHQQLYILILHAYTHTHTHTHTHIHV